MSKKAFKPFWPTVTFFVVLLLCSAWSAIWETKEYRCDTCGRRYSLRTNCLVEINPPVVDLDTGEQLRWERFTPNRHWCSDRCMFYR